MVYNSVTTMNMVGYVKWLENVMDNWVIKWQNEQNMWDFDKPFPLLQWFSVRLGMSQYSSLGMSQWIYTTPGAARSGALIMESFPPKYHQVENPARSTEWFIVFPPLTCHYVRVCMRACERERESATNCCPCVRRCLSPRPHLPQTFTVVTAESRRTPPGGHHLLCSYLDCSVPPACPPAGVGGGRGSTLRRHHCIWTSSPRLRLPPPRYGAPCLSLLVATSGHSEHDLSALLLLFQHSPHLEAVPLGQRVPVTAPKMKTKYLGLQNWCCVNRTFNDLL